MAGYELATAYVNLVVETGDVGRQIGGMFKGAEGAASSSGKAAGAAFTKAAGANVKLDVKAEADKAAAQVAVASKKVEAARQGEENAARKVEIAEAKLNELRASGKAKTSQILSAEDALARAKQSSALASQKTEKAVKDEAAAKTRSIAANDQLKASQRRVEQSTESAGREFTTLKSRMQAALKGNFKGAFSKIPKDADTAADKVENRFSKAGKESSGKFSSAFKGAFAGVLAYASFDTIVGGFKSIQEEAGNLEQSVGAIESVFKDNAGTMLKWSGEAAKNVGLSKNEFNELGTLIGSQLKNAGTPMKDLAGDTNNLIGLGSDLASMFGGTTRESVEAISSALKGERDPIEKYGVSLKQASIDAKAAELGFSKVGGSFDQNAQSAATVALIMDQTADAQGNFARESDTLAHKQQVAGAQWANLKGKMGDLFLPTLTRVMGFVTDKALPGFERMVGALKALGSWISGNAAWLAIAAGSFAVLGASAWIASGGLAAMGLAIKGVFVAISTGIKSIPVIGWVIAGIGLLVAALTWFFTKTEIGRKIWAAAWNGIKAATAAVVSWFQTTALPILQAVWNGIATGAMWLWNSVLKPVFSALAVFWQTVIVPVAKWLGAAFAAVFKAIAAVGSWLWNSVLKPVFTALVNFWKTYVAPVLQWLRGVFAAVFSLIGALVKYWWNNTVKPVFAALVGFWKNTIAPALRWLWTSIFKPIFGWIGTLIKNWWAGVKIIFTAVKTFLKTVLGPAFTWLRDKVIKPVWDGIKSKISSVWNNGIKPVFNVLGNFIKDKVAPKFREGVKAIGKAWDGIKETAKKPIRFVINTVINKGIVGTFNKIADRFPGTKQMPEIGLPKGFRRGGKVWGAGTETSDSIPARLSKNEHVLTAKDVRNLGGHGSVYALRKAAAKGWTPGLKKGGTLSDAARWLQSKGARITEFGAWGQRVGRHSKNSLHYTGNAFDANYGPGGENAIEKAFFDRIIGQFHSKFPGLRTIWRAPGHYNHFHADTSNGGSIGSGGSGGGGADILGGLLSPFKALKEKLTSQFEKYGKFGEIAKGMGKKAIDAPIEWIKSNISKVADFVSEGAEAVKGGIVRGAGFLKGQAWAVKNGLSLGNIANMNWLVSRESGWDPKAQNPRSTASGLPQFINSTSRQYLGGSPAKNYGVWAQLSAMQRYVNDRYNGWGGAVRFWKSHHYYRNGGAVIPEYDNGGMIHRGTQLIQHNKSAPDRVLTEKQWDGIYEAARVGEGRDGMTINLTTPVVERSEIPEWMDSVEFGFKHLSKTSAFSGRNG